MVIVFLPSFLLPVSIELAKMFLVYILLSPTKKNLWRIIIWALSVRPSVVVRPDEYLQHQWIFVSDTLHMHLLQSSHESCEVSSGSNSKWPTYRHCCLLKLTKYLKMLSVQMNISNTNEYLFPILYTCIYYNPPMNPVECRQDPMSKSLVPPGKRNQAWANNFIQSGMTC